MLGGSGVPRTVFGLPRAAGGLMSCGRRVGSSVYMNGPEDGEITFEPSPLNPIQPNAHAHTSHFLARYGPNRLASPFHPTLVAVPT